MCGIVGYVGQDEASAAIIEGLKRLEYRGYDSAGIASVDGGKLELRRAVGPLTALREVIAKQPIAVHTGIGHIRWATHGVPSETNAHPHVVDPATTVHNGIIENYQEIQQELRQVGVVFNTTTDTEVVPQLIAYYSKQGLDFFSAFKKCIARCKGMFALGVLDSNDPSRLYFVRNGAPLVLGHADNNAMFISSDATAIAGVAHSITYLEDGDYGYITKDGALIFEDGGQPVRRVAVAMPAFYQVAEKGDFAHFILKEIYEQPECLSTCLAYYGGMEGQQALANFIRIDNALPSNILIIACGTSYYTAMVAKYWLEELTGIMVNVEIGSEFRYRRPVVSKGTLVIGISQSGETADTLEALKQTKAMGHATRAIINARTTTMERLVAQTLHSWAGTEVGVASTKGFMTQLLVLALITIELAKARGTYTEEAYYQQRQSLANIPEWISEALSNLQEVEEAANALHVAKSVLFVGRGQLYPLALEGALKFKELSYIHAEGIAAGEFKHGPLAMVDADMPIVMLAPTNPLLDKLVSNAEEIVARAGKLYVITDHEAAPRFATIACQIMLIPKVPSLWQALVCAIPLQYLAYRAALLRGCNVDQPRNLAKSVTVE